MPGHLLIIAGLSGAGKTTLIAKAMRQLPDLRYLTTYTTRPPRESENSIEHIFVDEPTYQKKQQASAKWDHAEYNGVWYGTDVAAIRQLLTTNDVICAIAPDPTILGMLQRRYPQQTLIWVDTPLAMAKERISHDEQRHSRQENTELADLADFLFRPTGNLKADEQAFTRLITKIIQE